MLCVFSSPERTSFYGRLAAVVAVILLVKGMIIFAVAAGVSCLNALPVTIARVAEGMSVPLG